MKKSKSPSKSKSKVKQLVEESKNNFETFQSIPQIPTIPDIYVKVEWPKWTEIIFIILGCFMSGMAIHGVIK